jgi:hypothetical protein
MAVTKIKIIPTRAPKTAAMNAWSSGIGAVFGVTKFCAAQQNCRRSYKIYTIVVNCKSKDEPGGQNYGQLKSRAFSCYEKEG